MIEVEVKQICLIVNDKIFKYLMKIRCLQCLPIGIKAERYRLISIQNLDPPNILTTYSKMQLSYVFLAVFIMAVLELAPNQVSAISCPLGGDALCTEHCKVDVSFIIRIALQSCFRY